MIASQIFYKIIIYYTWFKVKMQFFIYFNKVSNFLISNFFNMKSLLQLWKTIYVYRQMPSTKKHKIYYTRSRVKQLNEVIPNPKVVNTILNCNVVKIKQKIPEEAAQKY